MSLAVGVAVEGARGPAVLSRRDYRLRASRLDHGDKAIGVITLVGNHLLGAETFDESWTLRDVMHFAASQMPTHRIAERVACHMNLGAQSSARASDRLGARFFRAPAFFGRPLFLGASCMLVRANNG